MEVIVYKIYMSHVYVPIFRSLCVMKEGLPRGTRIEDKRARRRGGIERWKNVGGEERGGEFNKY